MVKNMQKKLSVLIVMMLCIAFIVPANVFAAEQPNVVLKAGVDVNGEAPESDEVYILKLKDDAGNIQVLELKGEGFGTFPTMVYDRVGIYNYDLWQEPGDNPDCTYDDSVYHVKVTVYNNPEGEGLLTKTVARKNDDKKKSGELVFTNRYPEKEKPEPVTPGPSTGDQQNLLWYLTLLTASVLLVVTLYAKHE